MSIEQRPIDWTRQDIDRRTGKPERCDLECGDRWFRGQQLCRHGRTIMQLDGLPYTGIDRRKAQ